MVECRRCAAELVVVRGAACDHVDGVREDLRCPVCRAGGHRIRDRRTDVVLLKTGPALGVDQ